MENGITVESERHVYEVEFPTPLHRPSSTQENAPQRSNGQCVLAVPSSSKLRCGFDLPACRVLLERDGFQIPREDIEIPLQVALDPPSVRRYLLFSSSISRVLLTLVVYVVVWCGLYSTVHLYLQLDLKGFGLLCASVTLASILITTVIILTLHHSNKQININTDVRLIQVNERLLKHKLVVGLDDSERCCTGTLQLYFLFWDLSPCLGALAGVLEEMRITAGGLESKLQKRMSHLHLMTEESVCVLEDEYEHEDGVQETSPLLARSQVKEGNGTKCQKGALTKSCSLVPHHTLSSQVIAYRLLVTYSAAYVKLLVSHRLPKTPRSTEGPSHPGTSQCSVAPVCLCQYIHTTVLM